MNKELEEKLKPCPFCGEAASLVSRRSSNGKNIMKHWVGCANSKCVTPWVTSRYKSQRAIKAWNTRALQKDAKWAIERIRQKINCRAEFYVFRSELDEILDKLEKSE